MVTTGEVINNYSGDLLIMKSQTPFKPCSGSTLNSTPENKLISSVKIFLISIITGEIIVSEGAFSVLIANAKGTLVFRTAFKI
jgi:hypothetical protein